MIWWTGLLIGVLLAVAVIDQRRRIIPNWLNALLAAGGLLHAGLDGAAGAILSALMAAGALLILRWAYRRLRGIDGLGLGDVKFLAAAATWTGLHGLPWVLLFAAISGLLLVIASHLAGRRLGLTDRIAFGPHLAVGLLATWLLSPPWLP